MRIWPFNHATAEILCVQNVHTDGEIGISANILHPKGVIQERVKTGQSQDRVRKEFTPLECIFDAFTDSVSTPSSTDN